MLNINEKTANPQAVDFCKDFVGAEPRRRFIFGRNEYAEGVSNRVEVHAFVDDFTSDTSYLGRPIIRTEEVPTGSLVVSAVVLGRPLTAEKRLTDANIRHLDYFSFYEYCGLGLAPVGYWGTFKQEFKKNRAKYFWAHELLADPASRDIFSRLVNFRLSGDLSYMEGFTDRQKEQYFEDFLGLSPEGETFADVGCYDGYTSLEFIKRCPGYRCIYIFEPEPGNMELVKKNLSGYANVHFILKGLSDRAQEVRFSAHGSASTISDEGELRIQVDALDRLVDKEISLLKMDVEGAEGLAIEGARQAILKYHPKLAISAYHKPDDLWRIPELILSIRSDYRVYIRHYTEGLAETVIFFIP